jgi:hypothetical protein
LGKNTQNMFQYLFSVLYTLSNTLYASLRHQDSGQQVFLVHVLNLVEHKINIKSVLTHNFTALLTTPPSYHAIPSEVSKIFEFSLTYCVLHAQNSKCGFTTDTPCSKWAFNWG